MPVKFPFDIKRLKHDDKTPEKELQPPALTGDMTAEDSNGSAVCQVCGANLGPGVRFCGQCGSLKGVQLRTCQDCREPVAPGLHFCHHCGNIVEQDPAEGTIFNTALNIAHGINEANNVLKNVSKVRQKIKTETVGFFENIKKKFDI